MNAHTAADLLQIHQLCLRIAGRHLCENLDLTLKAGERLAILGPNGSGKTSLLHTLMGLQKPAAGHISLNGQPISQLSSASFAQHVGLLFQSALDEMPATVMEAVMLGRLPHQTRCSGIFPDPEYREPAFPFAYDVQHRIRSEPDSESQPDSEESC